MFRNRKYFCSVYLATFRGKKKFVHITYTTRYSYIYTFRKICASCCLPVHKNGRRMAMGTGKGIKKGERKKREKLRVTFLFRFEGTFPFPFFSFLFFFLPPESLLKSIVQHYKTVTLCFVTLGQPSHT